MAADSNPTKEILVREDKVPGGMVRVYYEIDEQERPFGKPRIVFVDSETAEEVPTKPLSLDIEALRKRQDLWLLEKPTTPYVGTPPKTCFEDYLRSDIPISVELATYSKQWLEEDNWQVSVERMIGCIEFRLRQVGILPHETTKTLDALKDELERIECSEDEPASKAILAGNEESPLPRTPHSTYAKHAKQCGLKREKAWRNLKQFAMKSKGVEEVDLPGYGLIYLKLDGQDRNLVRWKETPFQDRRDGDQVTLRAFQGAWGRS